MSGSSPTPAEQHLGDRLAALVDGELKHDARDRVLAHLATCPRCKAEADAQRRLKDVFAQTAPPPPSEGLLARLQGLPAGPGGGGDDIGGGPFGGGRDIDSIFGGMTPSAGRPGARRPGSFGYVPGRHSAPVLPTSSGGFRIHDVGRSDAERSPWRGRRFAFAAASAVSFAAIALGGALPLEASSSSTRGTTAGNTVTPLRTATGGTSGAAAAAATVRGSDYERRRGGAQSSTRSDERSIGRSVPGLLAPASPLNQPLTAPSTVNSVFAPPPLIRPTGSAFQLATAPGPTPPATPVPTHLVAPTHHAPPLTSTR
ncbi:anti-sigma factor family protein [Streptomyces sp. NPDC020965]|uniref:anti-sigma factor family protein n=1 Tax=Streptomyces sp. NPDC020965 TaxID=3365105 RepID=UPI0037A1C504